MRTATRSREAFRPTLDGLETRALLSLFKVNGTASLVGDVDPAGGHKTDSLRLGQRALPSLSDNTGFFAYWYQKV